MSGPTGLSAIPLTGNRLFEDLESRIVSQDLATGSRLPSERQLAQQYGLGRPIVREVLRRLEERGLIVVQAGRGSFVAEVEPTGGLASVEQFVRRGEVTARDLVRARRMLESEAAALAAEHHTAADAERMQVALDQLDASSGDVALEADLDLAFHETIVLASGNVVLQIMFGSIRQLSHAMMLRSLTDRRARRAGVPLHRTILDAILARDSELARSTMTEHIEVAQRHYGRDIDRPLAGVLRTRAALRGVDATALRRASSELTRP